MKEKTNEGKKKKGPQEGREKPKKEGRRTVTV